MIINNKPLSLAETKKFVAEYEKKLKNVDEEKDDRLESVTAYLKKFSKLSIEKSDKIKQELQNLDLMQLKEKHIIKIIDLLPADAEDLHKILIGEPVNLDKNEVDKILDIIKKYGK